MYPLKILPHILCRVGGLPFDVLESLKISNDLQHSLMEFQALEEQLNFCKNDLLTDLKTFKLTDFNFQIVRKLKKKIYKNQHLNLDIIDNFELKIVDKILIYNDLLLNRNNLEQKNEIQIELEKKAISARLQTLSKSLNFQNALPLSSIDFAKSLQHYWLENPQDFRKKTSQTERKVMQYIARISAKTSPFSTFTPLCYGQLTTLKKQNYNTEKVDFQLNKSIKWNNYLLEMFQNVFVQHLDIFTFLTLRLNATLAKNQNKYRYLINIQNTEVFQELEEQPILNLLETIFETQKRLSITQLLALLQEEIEAEKETILSFVRELIEVGFLEIDFGYHGNTQNWFEKVSDFVKQTPVFDEEDRAIFQFLERQTVDFQVAILPKRIEILEKTSTALQLFFNKYGGVNALSPEQLMYEDAAYTGTLELDEAAVGKLIQTLHELLQQLNFVKGASRLKIEHFFEANYAENAVVPLLDFYENYSKNGGSAINETEISSIQAESELLKKWTEAIANLVQSKYEFGQDFKIEVADLQVINEALGIQPMVLQGQALACFAQIYEADNQLKAVLNAVTTGYGKTVGRFLNLMPDAFTDDLRANNAALVSEILMADNVDASFFNANIHPPLLRFEIAMPESQNQMPKERQMNVTTLSIKKINGEVVLWHRDLGQQVQVFDLGIQTPEGRSPLYRLLMNFSPVTPDLYDLKNGVRQGILKTTTSESVIYPRVVCGNWTLMRQQWKLLDFGNLTENWNFFSILQYQKKLQNEFDEKITHQFYLKMDQQFKQKKSKKRTVAKPIYVDFENPILFNLIKKYNELNKNIYEITEMLPQKDHLLKIKQEAFFVECIFEWHIKSQITNLP